MTGLYIEAVATVARSRPQLRPLSELPGRSPGRQVATMIARNLGIPAELMRVRRPVPGNRADAAGYAAIWQALDALGPPEDDQALYLVHSGLVLDPMTAPLAAVVHALGWAGDDVGISHLGEHGGTQVFRLLGWVVPEDCGATVVIADDPVYVAAGDQKPAFATVALRLARRGALRIVASGSGSLLTPAVPAAARPPRVFSGPGACDAWLGLYAALSAGAVAPGELALLRTAGDARQGWLLLEAVRPQELRMTSALLEE